MNMHRTSYNRTTTFAEVAFGAPIATLPSGESVGVHGQDGSKT